MLLDTFYMWRSGARIVRESLQRITDDMYRRDMWDPKWRSMLRHGSLWEYKRSLYNAMGDWRQVYYIAADYHICFNSLAEYERWTPIEKGLIGSIFKVYMP